MSASEPSTRFPIRFERWYAALSHLTLISPSRSYLELGGADVVCRMDWAFRTKFDRSAVARVEPHGAKPLSRGVHGGFGGRWLVNGAGDGIVALTLDPPQRARVLGVPVRLKQLLVSVEDPHALIEQLGEKPRAS